MFINLVRISKQSKQWQKIGLLKFCSSGATSKGNDENNKLITILNRLNTFEPFRLAKLMSNVIFYMTNK